MGWYVPRKTRHVFFTLYSPVARYLSAWHWIGHSKEVVKSDLLTPQTGERFELRGQIGIVLAGWS
jgi:hypothetical protein